MSDHATPNLPSSSFAETSRFYAAIGFVETWRDAGWLILRRGDLMLEFFLDRDVDPLTTSAGSCLRLDDLDVFSAACKHAGLPETCVGQPRLHPPRVEPWGGRVGSLIDPDGNLLRLIQN